MKTKAIATLLFLSPVLAELLSGSSPASLFFNPHYFILQLISYGIPVLLIRELAIKWKLGIGGLFTLGLSYGIFNEGLLAHTFLQSNPSGFNGYGYYLGISFAWAPTITIWHALHAVLFPILIAQFSYPGVSQTRWLSERAVRILLAISFFESVFLYFAPHIFMPSYFFVFWALIILVALRARALRGSIEMAKAEHAWLAFASGLLVVIGYTILFTVSKSSAALWVYWLALLLFCLGFRKLLTRNRWFSLPALILFGCGSYVGYAIFATLLRASFEALATSAVLVTGLLIYAFHLSRFSGSMNLALPKD